VFDSLIHSFMTGLAGGILFAIPLLLLMPGTRRLGGVLALGLFVAALPTLAAAQADGVSIPGALVGFYPKAAPYLALVPIFQTVAVALAKIPRVFGVTHGTTWERILLGVAGLPTLVGFAAVAGAAAARNQEVPGDAG
jgi:hypothetical protein